MLLGDSDGRMVGDGHGTYAESLNTALPHATGAAPGHNGVPDHTAVPPQMLCEAAVLLVVSGAGARSRRGKVTPHANRKSERSELRVSRPCRIRL